MYKSSHLSFHKLRLVWPGAQHCGSSQFTEPLFCAQGLQMKDRSALKGFQPKETWQIIAGKSCYSYSLLTPGKLIHRRCYEKPIKVRRRLPVTSEDLWCCISQALRDMLKWLSHSEACSTPGLQNRLETVFLVPVLDELPTNAVILPNSKSIYGGYSVFQQLDNPICMGTCTLHFS